MKPRVKIDSAILSFIIILTGFIYLFPRCYPASLLVDNIMDVLGVMFLLKGTLLRMISRGHKKFYSEKGDALVTSGIYSVIRNPMYLGSFYTGVGFVFIVWPWWAVIIFAYLFYLRFRVQILKEEEHLEKLFGAEYLKYCKDVPRIFPSIKKFNKVKLKDIINWKEACDTKEKLGLIGWPMLGVVLETMQENIVFGYTNIIQTFGLFIMAAIIFAALFMVKYLVMNK